MQTAQDKLKVAPKQDGGTLSDGHECLLFQEPVKFKVLAPCTVRQGPEKDDQRVGEYAKGTVIEVVQEITNFQGLVTFQTTTPGKGHPGGFVKLKDIERQEVVGVCWRGSRRLRDMDQVRRGYTRGQHWARWRRSLDNRSASSNVPGLSTYNIKPQELRVSEVHADELQVQPPTEVVEFLAVCWA